MSDDLVDAAQKLAASTYKLLKMSMESKSDSELKKSPILVFSAAIPVRRKS